MESLLAYLNALSVPDQQAFARRVGTSLNYLRQAAYNGKTPKPERCVAIERASDGKVTRQMLRRDWRKIWPELAA